MIATGGCKQLPWLKVEVKDGDGCPVKGVPFMVTGSPGIRFQAVRKDKKLRPLELRGGRCFKEQTDADGRVSIFYSPPPEPGFFERLFGSKAVGQEWIRIVYDDASGRKVIYAFYLGQ